MMPPAPEIFERRPSSLALAQQREDAIARAHQHVLQERIGNLHRALVRLGVGGVERHRRERGAAETARIGRFSDQHDRPSPAAPFGAQRVDDLGLFDDPERDDVDRAIVVETLVEIDVAGDIRNADRVAVRADSVDHALRDVALMRVGSSTRPKRSGSATRDHFGAHAEHVAHDAADTGRRALERDDLRRMVVRFVRDDDAVAFAVVHRRDGAMPASSPGPRTTSGARRSADV